MKSLLRTLFILSLLLMVISVIALVVAEPTPLDIGIAIGFGALTATLYAFARWYLIRFGRIGLLKPKLFRKEQSNDSYKATASIIAAQTVTTAMSAEMLNHATGEVTIDGEVLKEMIKIKELGYHRKTRTYEELLSISKLQAFLEWHNSDRLNPPLSNLRDIRDRSHFFRLRKMVDDWYAKRAAQAAAYQAWLDEVGDIDQSHLLKDGWIAFLESLPGPDINLWHGIATDFHEMSEDRLNAALWIVEQETCDRTTASEFIMGFLEARMDTGHHKKHGGTVRQIPQPLLDRFISIVKSYNQGFYRYHSIPAGLHTSIGLEDAVADVLLTEYEKATGLTGLPRPKGIVQEGAHPPDPANRGYNSPYAYWNDAGLHLEYPGETWQMAG